MIPDAKKLQEEAKSQDEAQKQNQSPQQDQAQQQQEQDEPEGELSKEYLQNKIDGAQKIISDISDLKEINTGQVKECTDLINQAHSLLIDKLEPHLKSEYESVKSSIEKAISEKEQELADLDKDNPRNKRREVEIEEFNVRSTINQQIHASQLLASVNQSEKFQESMNIVVTKRDELMKERDEINKTHFAAIEVQSIFMTERDRNSSILDDYADTSLEQPEYTSSDD